MIEDRSDATSGALQARVAELEAALVAERRRADAAISTERARAAEALAAERARADEAIAERDRLRDVYRHLQLEVEMQRLLVVAKAERIDTQQLELDFAARLRELDLLAGRLPGTDDPETDDPDGQPRQDPQGQEAADRPPQALRPRSARGVHRARRSGARGHGAAHRQQDSYKLMWRRAGYIRLFIARVKYKVGDGDAADDRHHGAARRVAHALDRHAVAAHARRERLCDGLPLHRQEDRFAHLGVPIDRASMSRWLEDLGMSVGTMVVAAMRTDALAHAFCISTDATGVLVQPIAGAKSVARARAVTTAFRSPTPTTCFSSTRPRRPAPPSASCSAASPGTSRPTPRASTTCCSSRPISDRRQTTAPSMT